MNTSTVQVELPDPLGGFVAARVREGDFVDAAAYLQDLVRRDREAQVGRLRDLVQEGLDSGPARELSEADWATLRHRALGVAA
jgi:putative addiction module CopG family antidote